MEGQRPGEFAGPSPSPQARRFEEGWRTGQAPRIEQFLQDVPEPGLSTLLAELLSVEVRLRRGQGERPAPADYRDRFPAQAALVETVFADLDASGSDTRSTAAVIATGRPDGRGDPAASPATPHPDDRTSPSSTVSSPSGQGSPESPGPGRILGDYQLQEQIGRGGMGEVYRALHIRLRRSVAVKVMAQPHESSGSALVRFYREMQAIGALEPHPNLVRATDARHVGPWHLLIMELLDGVNLSELVRRVGPLAVADACEIIRQAALGLGYAHGHGIVHRDVKPSNLMLTSGGEVKVLDLGLALLQEAGDLTETGQLMGTPDYMAPEQAMDPHEATPLADVYGLGCTLYYLLVGQPPFPSLKTALQKVLAHQRTPIAPLRDHRPDSPEGLEGVLDRLLAKDPAARPGSAAEVAALLNSWCAGADLRALLDGSRRGSAPTESFPRPGQAEGECHDTGGPPAGDRGDSTPAPGVPAAETTLHAPRGRARAEFDGRRARAGAMAAVLLVLVAVVVGWRWRRSPGSAKAPETDGALLRPDGRGRPESGDGRASPSPTAEALALLDRSCDLARQGHPDRAIADYEAATRLDPAQVRTYLDRASECARRLAGLYHARGLASFDREEFPRAVAEYDEAIRLDPQLAPAYCDRAAALIELGGFDRALADGNQAVRLDPGAAAAFHIRGLARDELGDYRGAVIDFDEAIRLDPRSGRAFRDRASALIELGEHRRALADGDQAIRLEPKDPPAFHNRGLARYELGDYRGAVADFDQAILLDPRYARAYRNRAGALIELGEHRRALADGDEAIRLRPEDPVAFHNRGLARHKLRDHRGAVADYDEAIRLNPRYLRAYRSRAAALTELGEADRARADLEKAERSR